MRSLASSVLRQVARGRTVLPRRTFVSSARRFNSEGIPTAHDHLSQLMEQASQQELIDKTRHLTFVHERASQGNDSSEAEVIQPNRLTAERDSLHLYSFAHGFSSFPYWYLRDVCRCPRCVDPHSKQRSFRTSDIPARIYPRHMRWDGTTLDIKWANDVSGLDDFHTTSLDVPTLMAGPINTHDNISKSTTPLIWGDTMMKDLQHWVSFDDYMSNDAKFAESMRNLQRMGLIFIKDIPKSRELVKKISERMGPVRNSFYGETWDVRTVPQAKNVAYTNQHLGFHMDLLYMNEPPGYQLLHCLENSCAGGESLFADSFRVADIMKRHYPTEYKTLTRRLFGFEYMHNDHIYSNTRPLFEVDKVTGQLRNVNYSPPFQAPVPKAREKGVDNHVDFKQLRHALKTFTYLLESQPSIFQLKLNPGECVIFANRRIVHARNKFNTSSGSRWLAGAYVDEDALLSSFATNERKFPAQWKSGDPMRSVRKIKARIAKEKQIAVAAMQQSQTQSAKVENVEETSRIE
jgi:alpha-ketoglutarate-dependent taurine dioxygenase